ncbi:TonB-dependent siderophore receptor [Pontibacter sp. BAB1700]|uniref:TonB-dependent receptor plug domain-containing protein n=1 Tax=Pontibacter sp. BAB1700 TaxID=1144253 RepID=UPI0002F436D9|nr:hypothetical protein [Pontibacter sp. BAB1700]
MFEVTGPDFSRDFGKLQVKPDVKTLKEVTIQTMRPTITNDAEKMVVSVEGTALAQGSTAYEVLEKSPGVWVDQDGNITLNGKPGVQVMINGKQSYLSGKQLQNLLQGMSAENLKDVEIITNPSSRYDAEGASGIININLKKNESFGMNGNVYAGYQYNRLHSYNTGFDLSHKAGKWNTTAGMDFARRMNYRDMQMERIFNDPAGSSFFDQEGYEERERIAPTLRLGTDYDINDRHSVGFMSNLFYNSNEVYSTQSLRCVALTRTTAAISLPPTSMPAPTATVLSTCTTTASSTPWAQPCQPTSTMPASPTRPTLCSRTRSGP